MTSSNLRIVFGVLGYGLLAALTYLALSRAVAGPVSALPFVSAFASFALAPFTRFSHRKIGSSFAKFFRPLSFSTSQIAIAYSLQSASIFSTFYAAAVGTAVATLFGAVFLKERISRMGIIGILCVFLGAGLMKNSLPISMIALAAGILQGLTASFTRRVSLDGGHSATMAFANMATLWILSTCFCLLSKYEFVIDVVDTSVIVGAFGFALLQFFYCKFSRKLESWHLSLLLHSRIPWGYLIGMFFLGDVVTVTNLIGCLVLLLGLILAGAKTRPKDSFKIGVVTSVHTRQQVKHVA